MTDIFISYSQTDREFARKLYRELQRFKVRGFMDTVDVAAGADFSRQLKEAVGSADALLVILSEAATKSSWVMAEIGLAQALDKNVLPVLAPGQPYDTSVPPQLLDRVVVDANSLSLEEVAAKIVAATTNTSVESALTEVHSRVVWRQRVLIIATIVLAVLSALSISTAMFAYHQREVAIVQRERAEEAIQLAEARRRRLETLTADSASMAITPDGVYVATGTRDGNIQIWNLEADQTLAILVGHDASISGLAYSPDARLLASASWDGTIRVWDIQTEREVMMLTGHTDAVIGVQFMPDGKSLLSRSIDGTIRQWSVETGEMLRLLETPE